ncbi:hypothetical protein I305_04943 [Cryptococcus gattii E566]|uniref:Uncharacterized protein n=1 Tax=Cryptococcus gattii EJB2 TaxID=1296103 RepID=A0ABR5BRE5_9TREE|nr:hypothetical protein I306_04770 [Cryptococcus gattii EJB2]KIY32783.1 hypothetical protein I305_04943 [Cryptococcus gattii E566]
MTEKKKKRMKFITSCRLCPFVISAAVSSSSCRCPSPPPAPFLLFSFFSHLPSLTIWLCVFSIYSPPHGMLGASNNEKARKPASTRRLYERFLLRDDYRRRLPQWTWRFTGYRQPGDEPPSPLPFPPFTCHHVHQHSFSRRVLLPYHHYVLRRVGRPPFWCHRVTACSTSQFHRRAIRFGSGWDCYYQTLGPQPTLPRLSGQYCLSWQYFRQWGTLHGNRALSDGGPRNGSSTGGGHCAQRCSGALRHFLVLAVSTRRPRVCPHHARMGLYHQ